MADGVDITPGTGVTVATDELGSGAHAQLVKLLYGADGVATQVPADADGLLVNLGANNDVTVTSTTALTPGTAAANLGKAVDGVAGATDTGVAALVVRDDALTTLTPADGDYTHPRVTSVGRMWTSTTVDTALPAGTNNIGDVDVLTLPAIPAGNNNIGDVDVASIAAGDNNIGNVDVVTLPAIPAGTNNIGDVDVLTLPALPSGTNNIGDVDVLTVVTGTGATNLGKAVDSPAGATDTGVADLAIRDDALTTLTPVDGDYTNLRTTSVGRLWTSAVIDTALPAGTANIGDVDIASIAAGTTLIGGVNVRPGTTGGCSSYLSIDLDESEEEVKATAGQVFGYFLKNRSAAEIFVKFYDNTAAGTTVGSTTPKLVVSLEAKQAANVEFTNGIAFGTGICIAATTGIAHADTGAPAANDCVADILYA